MISNRWLEKRKPHWGRLEALVQKSKHGVSALSHGELQELGLLYRQTASDLAAVREDPMGRQISAYLNQLLGRGHNLIYSGHKPKTNALIRFYGTVYPRVFRETLPMTLLATTVCLLTAVIGAAITYQSPGFADYFLNPGMMASIEQKKMWTESVVAIKPLASSGIMTNNLTVAFTAFALGITAGIGTLWLMITNGLLLGVIGMVTWRAGMAVALWSFVAPHGSLELPAIFIAGGSGLEIARGLLFPGYLPRRESLAQAGSRAVKLLLGTVPMLIVAGVIEGFFSPGKSPAAMKFTLGAVLFAALMSFLFFAGRRRGSQEE